MRCLFLLFSLCLCFFSLGFGIGEKSLRWKKNTIKICWGGYYQIDDNLVKSGTGDDIFVLRYNKNVTFKFISQERKKHIQKLVLKHYPETLTGKKLIGWQECKADEDIDLVILGLEKIVIQDEQPDMFDPRHGFTRKMIPDEKPAVANIPGYRGVSNIGNSYTRFDIDKKEIVSVKYPKTPKYQVYMPSLNDAGVLHEFGHFFGLRHEHIREEASDDPNCKLLKGFESREVLGDTAEFFTAYDSKSIMNYCYLEFLSSKKDHSEILELSLSDKHSLRCLYDDNTQNCDADFVIKK